MKRYEVLGNKTATLCELLGSYFTLGAARKAADKAFDDPRNVIKYVSIDVDNGFGKVFYTKSRPPGLMRQILEAGGLSDYATGEEEIAL